MQIIMAMMHNTDYGYASRNMRIVAPCFFSFSQPKLIMLQLRQPSTLSINSINDVDSVVHIMQEDHFTLSNAHVMMSVEYTCY